jgi:hypothetical protein
MRRLIHLLILFIAIGQFEGEVLAKTRVNFGTCDIRISDHDEDDRTGISQTAIVKDRNSGLTRKVGSFVLDHFLLNDFPARGIDTFIIREWTGGAHCCYSDFVIIYEKASGKTQFQHITSARSEGEAITRTRLTFINNRITLELLDYLDIEDMNLGHLALANSPCPTRLIVFDSDLLLWKGIPPNHSISYYNEKYAETIEVYDRVDPNNEWQHEDRLKLAIEAAYHAYMAGASNARLDRILYDMVPKEYRDEKDKDILRIRKRIIQRANSFQAEEAWLPDVQKRYRKK